ncbi:MAG: glutathione S-transferase family protein [Aestuariivita sp.]|nr:glutathione S-transferase family protein [Aestuariivita sp.]MCY4203703.1 glutathione S-transferase family protein [Aestuariivita sp.]MCY4287035.1 glutathione S-transferase family protein [Aestuariivita sp.]MCY4347681.1 glutathione S-transferase family protein [Aestuariivita sp.]
MKLHYAPKTVAGAAIILMFETDVAFEPVRVDFAKTEQRSSAYLVINPKGRVPTLDTPHGIITETTAILEYIASLGSQPSLIPKDPFAAAQMRSSMSYLATTMHVNHAHGVRGHRWANEQSSWDDMKSKVSETMAESAAFIESNIIHGPYVMGDAITIADPYLFIMSNWLEVDGVTIENYPKFNSFQEEMLKRPSVIRAQQEGLI